jgi:methylenetetrahydrofolate dehydrogenase (NADP+)/methenyltetrahydrofolate cyclohydrolase
LPLPKHIPEDVILRAIDPDKDVDCFHPYNVGRMCAGDPLFLPCTPHGVLQMIKRSNIETSGADCVIVGRSNIVGRPLMNMLSQRDVNCTVTVCHSRTKDLKEKCASADILIAAIGVPEFVKADMVKQGAVVIDVGINRVEAPDTEKGWKLVGDVEYQAVAEKASHITPVPGGVGPMTIAMLMYNTVTSAKQRLT